MFCNLLHSSVWWIRDVKFLLFHEVLCWSLYCQHASVYDIMCVMYFCLCTFDKLRHHVRHGRTYFVPFFWVETAYSKYNITHLSSCEVVVTVDGLHPSSWDGMVIFLSLWIYVRLPSALSEDLAGYHLCWKAYELRWGFSFARLDWWSPKHVSVCEAHDAHTVILSYQRIGTRNGRCLMEKCLKMACPYM